MNYAKKDLKDNAGLDLEKNEIYSQHFYFVICIILRGKYFVL